MPDKEAKHENTTGLLVQAASFFALETEKGSVNKLQLLHWLFEEEEQGCFFGILHKNEKIFL